MKLIAPIMLLTFLMSCQEKIIYEPVKVPVEIQTKRQSLDKEELKNWYIKDLVDDTIPGISLKKAFNTILKDRRGKEIIIAMLDMEVDIHHDKLEGSIWQNPNETLDGEDNDNNGYVDDVNGWNFLGDKNGQSNRFVNYEYTRVIRKFEPTFNHKIQSNIAQKDSFNFLVYQRAKEKHTAQMLYAIQDKEYGQMLQNIVNIGKEALSPYFPDGEFTIKDLDSLKAVYPDHNTLQLEIKRMSNFKKYGYTEEYIKDYLIKAEERLDKMLDLNYDDRVFVGDDSENINDTKYGNHILNSNTDLFKHGTKVAGVLAFFAEGNDYGDIKIMPLCISSFGDEHDKDIALAMRYAVDNGAKVINMSFGKGFSLYKKWVDDALQYAEKNNVLVVTSVGNGGLLLDEIFNYPNDTNADNEEIVGNFIKVGASSYTLDTSLYSKFSNYGKREVDIFAPGNDLYTLLPKNIESFDSGTSLASGIVSGTAALLFSFYPSLTASEIKEIILESGLKYTHPVLVPTKEAPERQLPFNQLSKSGKIVNAYNAILMAEKMTKEKDK